MSTQNYPRRRWLKLGALAALALVSTRALAQAQKKGGAAAPRLEENDPQAQALGYKHDAANVDKAKFPNYQSGQVCANCNFYKAKETDPWGPCDIFAGRQVSAKGWCAGWVKRA